MATVAELFDRSREGDRDSSGSAVVRVFQVTGATREQAAIVAGIPQIGTAFEWNNTLVRVDSISVSGTVDPNVQEVTCKCSSDGRFVVLTPGPVDPSPDAAFIETSSRRAEFEIPAFEKYEIPRVDGTSISSQIAYRRIKFTTQDYYVDSLSVQVNLETFTSANRRLINATIGKVHRFNASSTERYRYIGCSVSRVGNEVWRLRHEWIGDPGTPAIITGQQVDVGAKYVLPTIARPPFFSYVVDTASREFDGYRVAFPFIDVQPAYDENDEPSLNSWQALPGNPGRVL